MSVMESSPGAGALVMGLCCVLLPLIGAAIGGGLLASTGAVGIMAGVAVLAAVVATVTRRCKYGRRC